jgi:signal transduction histidine kinase
LRGMRERATLIQGKLVVWSEVDEGTEVELRVAAGAVYRTDRKPSRLFQKFSGKMKG